MAGKIVTRSQRRARPGAANRSMRKAIGRIRSVRYARMKPVKFRDPYGGR